MADQPFSAGNRRGQLASLSAAARVAARSPATWVFAAIYVLAAITLIATGNAPSLAVEVGLAIVLAILALVTVALTASEPRSAPATNDAPLKAWQLWAQLGVLAVIVLFTLYAGMVFNDAAPRIPVLFDAVQGIYRLSTLVLNPILYVVVPGIFLLLLGAGLRSLGLARGWHAWAVSGVWSILPAIAIGAALIMGRLTALQLLGALVGNTLQNGPMEEFLWRGAVLTRLRLLLGAPWSIVASSLLFGVWHIGANLSAFSGQLAPALAFCFVSQATIGLAFALVFIRTRNLLAPSVAHVLLNVASALMG